MKNITGNFQYPNGQPAAGAVLTLLLSQDATQSSGQIMHVPIVITLDNEGNIPSVTEIMANDEISPSGTTYKVSVKDPVYGLVYFENLSITGTSPININLIAPTLKT